MLLFRGAANQIFTIVVEVGTADMYRIPPRQQGPLQFALERVFSFANTRDRPKAERSREAWLAGYSAGTEPAGIVALCESSEKTTKPKIRTPSATISELIARRGSTHITPKPYIM